MATTRQYYANLRNTRDAIASRLGVDIPSLPADRRVPANATLGVIAVIIKALTDNGVLTDAQLQAAQIAALAEIWPWEPPTDPPVTP